MTITQCQKCQLHKTRKNVVLGEGPYPVEFMFIGEAPGRHEDEQARPFVGQAGTMLTLILKEIGLHRADVYITNLVKCRPPENRLPRFEEREACKTWVLAEIAHLNPTRVILMGRSAAWLIPYLPEGTTYKCVYHPAYALYRRDQLDPMIEQYRKAVFGNGKPNC